MIEGVANPVAYGLAVVCFGGWILVFWMVRLLFAGKVRTEAELVAAIKRAETAEASLRIRDTQVNAALEVLPKIGEVLRKFHVAGEEVRQEMSEP